MKKQFLIFIVLMNLFCTSIRSMEVVDDRHDLCWIHYLDFPGHYLHVGSFDNQTKHDVILEFKLSLSSKDKYKIVLNQSLSHVYLSFSDEYIWLLNKYLRSKDVHEFQENSKQFIKCAKDRRHNYIQVQFREELLTEAILPSELMIPKDGMGIEQAVTAIFEMCEMNFRPAIYPKKSFLSLSRSKISVHSLMTEIKPEFGNYYLLEDWCIDENSKFLEYSIKEQNTFRKMRGVTVYLSHPGGFKESNFLSFEIAKFFFMNDEKSDLPWLPREIISMIVCMKSSKTYICCGKPIWT
jgi:hypothetical protein